jgi:hypothetical protein
MRTALLAVLALGPLGCLGWPATKMEPASQYGAREKPTVSSIPSFTAGTNYMPTGSPDGATAFVCADGSDRPANEVALGAKPPC